MGSPSEIFGLTVGVTSNITGEVSVCVLNLFWWVISSSDFQGIEMTHFSYPTWELAEDISSLFSLLSTNDHTGVDWVGKPDIKNNDDDDAAMDNIN